MVEVPLADLLILLQNKYTNNLTFGSGAHHLLLIFHRLGILQSFWNPALEDGMPLLGRCVLIAIIFSSSGSAIAQNASKCQWNIWLLKSLCCLIQVEKWNASTVYGLKVEIIWKLCLTLVLFHVWAIMNSPNGLISRALHLSIPEVKIPLRPQFFKTLHDHYSWHTPQTAMITSNLLGILF